MKKQLRILLSISLLLASLFVSGLSPTAHAATTSNNSITSNGNGYRISPVRTDLIVAKGQTSSVTVYLTNISTAKENLQIQVDDFQAKDETGTPALLLNGQSLPRHGLKKYTILPTGSIQLNPGDQKSVVVKVAIPNNATAGGYYGAVRFTPVGANGQRNVNLAASVGSLILVKVPGNINESVSIVSFGVARGGTSTRSIFFSNKSLQAIVRFQNNGDVQEEPFGKIQLKKGDATLASYEVNNTDQRGNILPESIRRFTVPLDKVGSFGKFTVEGNFGYGSSGQLISASSSFYVIPVSVIFLIVVLILLVIAAIVGLPRAIRRHDKRILRRARRQR